MTKIDWLREAEAISPEITALRETLHRRPEPGNQELETAKLIERTLQACGIEIGRMLDTAVVGTLTLGKPGPCVALRADMDALPVTEQTHAVCSSEVPGVMHACGHDVHMAAALGAAMLLGKHRDDLCGTVKFFFQPDEEGTGGAQRMIAAGCMEGVDAIFGAHVAPDLPLGHIGVRFGKFYAASDTFRILVRGRSCHGATPEKGVDALAAACELALRLKKLPAELGEPCVLTVGTLCAGTAINVLAGEAELTGILRTLGKDSRAYMKRRLRETARAVEETTGAAIDVFLYESYPGIVNHDGETGRVQRVAARLLGENAVTALERPTMTTEDFGFFLDETPGSYYHIGAGCEYPLHSPHFFPDERAAVMAGALHAAVLADFLEETPAQGADWKGTKA